MIGIDTNVLVRIFVDDSPVQTKAALTFLSTLSSEAPGHIGTIVVVELIWVLKRVYRFDDDAIYGALDSLFRSANVEVERSELTQAAIDIARTSGADVSDVMIALAAREAGVSHVATFDKKAAKRVPGMELLT
jgi:predicted nucleic-acid-binding protein